MNLNWKVIGFYMIGASVGGFAGALAGSYIADKMFTTVVTEPLPEDDKTAEDEKSTKPKKKGKKVVASVDEITGSSNTLLNGNKTFKTNFAKPSIEDLESQVARYKTNGGLVRPEPEQEETPVEKPARKTVEGPHVISYEEFSGANGYEKSSLTYYAGDDILADENDEVLHKPANLLGPTALSMFGKTDSGDPHVIYVRNPSDEVDYEVILNKGRYKVIVMGELPPAKPSAKRPKYKKGSGDNNEDEDA